MYVCVNFNILFYDQNKYFRVLKKKMNQITLLQRPVQLLLPHHRIEKQAFSGWIRAMTLPPLLSTGVSFAPAGRGKSMKSVCAT